MINNSKSLLEYSRNMILPETMDESVRDKLKEVGKKVEERSRKHLGDKTTEAIKGTAREVATAAAKSVKDKLIQKAKNESGEAIVNAGKWALRKALGKK